MYRKTKFNGGDIRHAVNRSTERLKVRDKMYTETDRPNYKTSKALYAFRE